MADESTLRVMAEEIAKAQAAILGKARERADEWWNPRDLRDAAQNGSTGDVMMFALTDLVNRGQLKIDSQLRVRLPE
jgi:hypothetical protein